MRTLAILSATATVLVAAAAFAHDLYVMPERFRVAVGETLTVALHNGDAFPESEASVAVERLRDASLRAGAASAPLSNLRVEANRTLGNVTVPAAGTLVLTARTIPNLIELAPDKFTAYLKEEGQPEVIQWRAAHGESGKPGRERYSKYIKSLLLAGTPSDAFQTVVGFPIEIIPEKDPYRLKPGDSLPVRVLFRGAPAAGLQVESAWAGAAGKKVQVAGRTNAEGRVNVPLAQAGRWRLHAIKMERCADPKAADWESFWSSLTFELR